MSKADSKMIVGGATFGNKYGVTNQEMMTETESILILNEALESGFLGIDTAPVYGESEKTMGLAQIQGKEIYTKILGTSLTNGLDGAFASVLKSMSNLGVDQITGITFHSSSDYLLDIDLSVKLIDRLMNENLIKSWGISLYSPNEINSILEFRPPKYFQVPVNIVDHRFLDPMITNILKRNKISIHARSIYLQGVLLQEPSNLAPHFQTWSDLLDGYSKLANKSHVSLLEFALGFVASQSSVERIVIGLNSQEQMRQIVSSNERNSWDGVFDNLMPSTDLELIDPRYWS